MARLPNSPTTTPDHDEKDLGVEECEHQGNQYARFGISDEDASFYDNFGEEKRKRLFWKVDLRLVPFLALLYLAAHIDRANIGNAKIEGLIEDVNLTGLQYNIVLPNDPARCVSPSVERSPRASSVNLDADSRGAYEYPYSTDVSRPGSMEPTSQDPAGNAVGSISAYTWVQRAFMRLNKARKLSANRATIDTALPTRVTEYGDANPDVEPLPPPLHEITGVDHNWLQKLADWFFERACATYRYLHRPTVNSWISALACNDVVGLGPAQLAVTCSLLAYGCLYLRDDEASLMGLAEAAARDEWLTEAATSPATEHEDHDSEIEATVLQAKLCRIINRVISSNYEAGTAALLKATAENNAQLDEWQRQVPLHFSGAVRPSQRQAIVLRLFQLHAIMLTNRPLLLQSFAEPLDSSPSDADSATIQKGVDACVSSALDVVNWSIQCAAEGQRFAVFWFTQNVAFIAISILYLSILRTLASSSARLSVEEERLLSQAHHAYQCLADASKGNSPGLKYAVVLEELQKEVNHQLQRRDNGSMGFDSDVQVPDATVSTPHGGGATGPGSNSEIDFDGFDVKDTSLFWPESDALLLSLMPGSL